MSAIVLRGDARRLPLPDASVDLIVTSPPYFGLRSYTDEGYCAECRIMREQGRDPRQAWPDYDAHWAEVHAPRPYDGQIGSEATPGEWVAALVECTREWARVLKPSGSMFVNLGDKYSTGNSGDSGMAKLGERWAGGGHSDGNAKIRSAAVPGLPPKTLLGLPWRYAIAATDQLGLILRRDIIWAKPNGLPESVTDRCRSSHEYVFHLTRQPRYYAAVDEIREPHQRGPNTHAQGSNGNWNAAQVPGARRMESGQGVTHRTYDKESTYLNPLGKLPGSVWNIPSQPLTVPPGLGVDHFAAFPSELPRRCVLGWSPGGVCVACGEGRRPVVETQPQPGLTGALIETRRCDPSGEQEGHLREFIRCHRKRAGLSRADVSERVVGTRSGACWNWEIGPQLPSPSHWRSLKVVLDLPPTWDHLMLDTYMRPSGQLTSGPAMLTGRHQTRGSTGLNGSNLITGYACACPTPDAATRPAIVLDPFGGTGTTALVASVYGRTGISIDHSADYNRIAAWRTQDPAERCRVIGAPKPPPVLDGQDALFDLAGDTT